MKVESLVGILVAQMKVLEGVGAHDAAAPIRFLADALEPARAAQMSVACKTIVTLQPNLTGTVAGHAGPPIGSSLGQLRLMLGVLQAASAKSAAADVATLVDALEPIRNCPFGLIAEALKTKPKASRAASRNKTTIELGVAAVRQIADRLVSANGDDQAFKSVLSELKAQRLSKPDVFAIANRFLGVEAHRTYKSADLAFKRIEERHFQDALSESRARAINQINH